MFYLKADESNLIDKIIKLLRKFRMEQDIISGILWWYEDFVPKPTCSIYFLHRSNLFSAQFYGAFCQTNQDELSV